MKNNTIAYLLFLINPFIALFAVLKNFRTKNIAFYFPIFLAFIGASLYPIGDAEVYRNRFHETHEKGLSFVNFKKSLLDGETSFDVAIPLISYSIANVTRNEKVLFAVFGLILGFFYGANIQYVLDKIDKKQISYFVYLLVFVFSMIVAFWDGIRGVRMWTAAHIYFYGVSRIIDKRNIRSFIFLVLACAYHFSFLLPVFAFLFYYFLPKKNILPVAFIFFISSIFFAESNVALIKGFVLEYTPQFFESKSEGYTNEEYMVTISKSQLKHSFHHAYSGSFIKYSFIYLLILAYVSNRSYLKVINNQTKYFLIVFILFGLANYISVLPSGGRFIKIALLFSVLPIYYGYQTSIKRYLYHITFLPLLFWLFVTIREGFYSLSIGSILGNPLLIFFEFATKQNLDSLIK